jgi:hypothetical protein
MATVTSQLLTAANYALLAAAGITNSGSTVIKGGNVGSFPTTSITPGAWVLIPPSVIDNADAHQANLDGLAAYNFFSALTFVSLSASSANLSVLGNGGTASTYLPGNYSAGSSMDIPTSITLDAQGNPNAVFIFKSGSTVTLESGASILLANGANANNIVWLVGSSLTTVFAGVSVFNGQVLANTSITLGGGVFNGRALAGLVTSSGAITIATALTMTTSPSASNPTTAGGQAQALIASQPGQTFLQAYPQVTPGVAGPLDLDLLQIIDEGGTVLSNVDYTGAVHGGTGSFAASFPLTSVAVSQFVLTSVALSTFAVASVVASTGVYTGTFPSGGSNAYVGQTAEILGFTNPGNNGSKVITASTTTTITVAVGGLTDESASATASITGFSTATYNGTITGGASNAYLGCNAVVAGFTNAGNNITFAVTASTATTLVGLLTSQVTETHAGTAQVVGVSLATYTGTIAGGALNALAGRNVSFSGFVASSGANNVANAIVVASTATTLVVVTTAQVAETHAGTATLTAAFTPTYGVRLGQYFTRLTSGATIAQLFNDAFTNPSLLDIVHIVNLGGNVSYVLDHNGVASGS